jgi:hypothetical protein
MTGKEKLTTDKTQTGNEMMTADQNMAENEMFMIKYIKKDS